MSCVEVDSVLSGLRFLREAKKEVDVDFYEVIQNRLMQDFMIKVFECAKEDGISFTTAFHRLGVSEIRSNYEKLVVFGEEV